MAKAPVCCQDGWKLVYAGSRFTRNAEPDYAPTEGEALAVAWGLEHARMFVLGCDKLTISTDHKPLLGILKDRDLSSISNPRIFELKQRTLPYYFNIQYNPGKWHRAPDAFSRNPVSNAAVFMIYADSSQGPMLDEEKADLDKILQRIMPDICSLDDVTQLVSMKDVENAASKDDIYQILSKQISTGWPKARNDTDKRIHSFWSVRNRLSLIGNVVMMDNRIVIPASYQSKILKLLHLPHQGVSSMSRRCQQSIYWPGLESGIKNTRYTCRGCNENSPSQTKEPYCGSPPPDYPFQQICSDYFEVGHNAYLSIVDRFSCWIIIYHFPHGAKARQLVSICRNLFTAYGVSEEISTDGGPQFKSDEFKTFLENWGVQHRKSSVDYPQSNGRAELSVKTAKRIIMDNSDRFGALDNDRAAMAILQHRNTPIPEIGLSPAQLLLHRQLRDAIPSSPSLYRLHKEWIVSGKEREKAFSKRDILLKEKYNAGAHPLLPLQPQDSVLIQCQGKWNRSGKIVEALPNRQYRIRMDGSGRVTLRNRRFLKKLEMKASQSIGILPGLQGILKKTDNP